MSSDISLFYFDPFQHQINNKTTTFNIWFLTITQFVLNRLQDCNHDSVIQYYDLACNQLNDGIGQTQTSIRG